MKKKLVAFAVTAAMIVTSAVPALAWAPAGSQDWPTTNEVVMDSTHLQAGIENELDAPVANGDVDSITVDFNRTEGKFEYYINLATNMKPENPVPYFIELGDNNVKVGKDNYPVEGIVTLTWRFDTTDAQKQFLELVIDEMNTNAEPTVVSIPLDIEYETVVSTELNAAGNGAVTGGNMLVMYQNQIPSKVVDVEVVKAEPNKTGSAYVPALDKYGKVQVVEQPVIGETYIVNSITLDDGTVLNEWSIVDGKRIKNNVIANYVTFDWDVIRNGKVIDGTDVADAAQGFTIKEGYKGCNITLKVAGNKVSGIFSSVVWGEDADALAVQKRIAGENRYETAMAVADQMKDANGFETIFVATGRNYADALSATALASKMDAPILLVDGVTGAYEDEVAAYIEKNAANYDATIYIVGGEKAVSKDFADKVYKMNYDVKRLAGDNRYETNLAILKAYDEATDKGLNDGMRKVLVATGKNYADALTASVTGLPVLLVGDNVTVAQRDFLQSFTISSGDYRIQNYVIVGGTNAVKPSVKNVLSGKGFVPSADAVTRIGGADRYETNRAVVNKLMNGAKNAPYVFVATGTDFPDALTGGVLAAENNSPIVLVNEAKTQIAKNIVKNVDPAYGFVVLGGENAVSNETVQKIA